MRTGLPLTRDDARDCPAYLAVKARPWLITAARLATYEPLMTFALKPLMAALDQVEHNRHPLEEVLAELRHSRGAFGRGRPAHDGLVEWTAEALIRYLDRREADQHDRVAAGEPRTEAVPEEWVVRNRLPDHASPDARGARLYERTAWGRRYASADGSVRELRLLSFGSAKKERPEAETAAAAFVAAFGEPCRSVYDVELMRTKAFEVVTPYDRMVVPQRVRIIDVGCGDGSAELLAERSRDEAQSSYDQHTRPVLGRVLDAAERRPGNSCVECPGAGRCPALPSQAGLVGLPAPRRNRKRRSLSASDLRAYTDCPAKYHLTRELNLRTARPENQAIRRGRAVDAVLNERHAVRRSRGCRGLPAPATSAWPGLDEETVHVCEAMLAQHAAVCPLDRLGATEEVRVQATVTAYDPTLDVVLIAKPDLLHTRRGGWIWRETKTTGSRIFEGKPVLEIHPQLALAVLLMQTGELAEGDRRRSRIELELLHEEDSDRLEIDPWQPDVLQEARRIVGEAAGPWLEDTAYTAAPGTACENCEALDWCRVGQAHQVEQAD
ncbi:PD-(D/E)XK nuclease family protein [Streptomyces sioyaensis]|uniref:PD-(D/E)XK nuclease family protein n=1 Tax=Streptomyces sioyaensis TaxID=67364 RepID=UPI003D73E6EF